MTGIGAGVGVGVDEIRVRENGMLEVSVGAMTDEPVQTFASLRNALSATPAEASHIRPRSALAIAVRGVVETWRTTQAAGGRRLPVSQPLLHDRLDDLLGGGVDRFSLDALAGLAERAAFCVRIEIGRDPA